MFGRALDLSVPIRVPVASVEDEVIEYARLQDNLDQFWNRWQKEYLLMLRPKHWPTSPLPKEGDLVIVTEDRAPRFHWPVAVIRKLHFIRDGYPRRVEVQLRTRPLQRLVPLESAPHPDMTGDQAGGP